MSIRTPSCGNAQSSRESAVATSVDWRCPIAIEDRQYVAPAWSRKQKCRPTSSVMPNWSKYEAASRQHPVADEGTAADFEAGGEAQRTKSVAVEDLVDD